jgi:two-component system NtrC family sensor kinase
MVEEAGWMGDLIDEEELQQSESLDEFKTALEQIRIQGERCKEITQARINELALRRGD